MLIQRMRILRAAPEQRTETGQGLDARRRAAFERLWERERPRIWRLTARLSGSTDVADDLTQEVGLRALAAYGGFRGASAESTWLYRIAVNTSLRWREQRDRRRSHGDIDIDAVPEVAGPIDALPEQQALRTDANERMQRALEGLPEEMRTPLLLHAWEGMKYREIAALLEIPMGTVTSRLNAARVRLRRELGEEGDDHAM